MSSTRAFTLVELSIVLVIIGLLVGGVLAGRALIHSAELRSVMEQKRAYTVATLAFRDKYHAYPGDISNATAYFPGAVNGDGDDFIGSTKSDPFGGSETIATGNAAENWGYWQHLAMAGMIAGSYTGTQGPLNGWHAVAGTNVPKAKYNGAVWCVSDPRYGWRFKRDWSNMVTFARAPDGVSDWTCSTAILPPEDAYSIDKKIDDGMPGTGSVAGGATPNCTDAWTDFWLTDTAVYNLGNQDPVCLLSFKLLN